MAVTGSPELLIVMGAHATPEEIDHVVERLAEAGADAHVTPGREATVIGAIGERDALAALPLEGFPGVEQVLPILKPYKLVSRELSPDPTVIEVRGRRWPPCLSRGIRASSRCCRSSSPTSSSRESCLRIRR